MLVLSRKETERIRLGKSIVVTVVRVSGDKVRLGIEAPPDVLVLREELQPHEAAYQQALNQQVLDQQAPDRPELQELSTASLSVDELAGLTGDLTGEPATELEI